MIVRPRLRIMGVCGYTFASPFLFVVFRSVCLINNKYTTLFHLKYAFTYYEVSPLQSSHRPPPAHGIKTCDEVRLFLKTNRSRIRFTRRTQQLNSQARKIKTRVLTSLHFNLGDGAPRATLDRHFDCRPQPHNDCRSPSQPNSPFLHHPFPSFRKRFRIY